MYFDIVNLFVFRIGIVFIIYYVELRNIDDVNFLDVNKFRLYVYGILWIILGSI